MNTATCNWTTMRVIDYFWLLLLPLLCLTNQAQALSCRDIVDGSSFEKFEKCTLEAGPLIGNSLKFVRLDFSTTKGDQITNFLAQLVEDQGITPTLSAAFRLVDNKDITQIDFGNINEWTVRRPPEDEVIIEIANNINLEKFLFEKVPKIAVDTLIKVAIYNNPKLVWNDHEKKIIAGKKTTDSFFETEQNACTFQNPLDKTKAIAQTAELMEKCQIFKGDLNLEGSALKDEITLKDGCLRLVNVDMTKITNITAENGQEQCTVDGVTPEIKNNPGLCGDKMATVAEYAPKAAIQLHKTCTISCKDQATVDHKFYRCNEIDAEGISLNQWFTPGHENAAKELKQAKIISIKGSPNIAKISLPALKHVNDLEISGNPNLVHLDLSSLENAGKLTITNNEKLTVEEIGKLPRDLAVGHLTVECHTNEFIVISDLWLLRPCTKIIGQLIIRNVIKDVDAKKFNITEIAGCVTIQDTSLSNLGFLDKAKITCNGQHTLKDNKELCKPRFLGREKGAEITANGLKTTGCGKICTSLSEKDCVVFNGNLTVNEKTRPDDIALLEAIEGQLTITGAGPSLEFPVLATINSRKAPGLLVSNNPNLVSLKMPKIQMIKSLPEDQPKVKIEKSPKLTDLKQFLPSDIADTCSHPDSTTCQYDMAQKKEESDKTGLIAGLSAGGFLLLVLIAVGLAIWCCLRKKKKRMKKEQAEAEVRAKLLADTRDKALSDERARAEIEVMEKQEEAEAAFKAKIDSEVQDTEAKVKAKETKLVKDATRLMAERDKVDEMTAGLQRLNEVDQKKEAKNRKKLKAEVLDKTLAVLKPEADVRLTKAEKEMEAKYNRELIIAIAKSEDLFVAFKYKLLPSQAAEFGDQWIVIKMVQRLFPSTNNMDYLLKCLDFFLRDDGIVAVFRILIRTKLVPTIKDVEEGIMNEVELDMYKRIHDKGDRPLAERIGFNRPLFYSNKDYNQNDPLFLKTMLSSGQPKQKKNKKKKNSSSKSGKKGSRDSKGSRNSKSSTEKLEKIRVFHFGTGFKESMAHNKNIELIPIADEKNKKKNEQTAPPLQKTSPQFECLKTTYYKMTYNDGNQVHRRELELSELILPEKAIGKLHTLIQCPWMSLLNYAWQHNIVVHTDVIDYFVCCWYGYTFIDFLAGRIGYDIKYDEDDSEKYDPDRPTKAKLNDEELGRFLLGTVYPAYHRLFTGNGQYEFDEITAFTIFFASVLEFARELSGNSRAALNMKNAIELLITMDKIIEQRCKDEKPETVYWSDYFMHMCNRLFKKGLNLKFFEHFKDTTPYTSPKLEAKLVYAETFLEYNLKKDHLKPFADLPILRRDELVDAAVQELMPKKTEEGEKKKKVTKTDEE